MKRTIIILLFWGFCLISANAQFYADPASNDTVHYPYWLQMMQDPEANFRSSQSAFEKYWAGRTDYQGNGWKVFKRWEYIQQYRAGKDGKLPSPLETLNEYNRYLEQKGSFSVNGNWTQIGPVTLPSNATSQPNGMGRINAVAFHPVNANVMFAASPSGGLWTTANGGASWSVLTSSTPTLGVSSILIHPTSTNTILIGTGDRDGGDAPGMGVYKSIDGGVTWTPSNTGITGSTVGMMIMHPTNPNIIIAATSTGIFKSTNGGSTWILKSSNANNYKDIKFKPGDPSIVYAASGGLFYRSINTGETWTQITSGIIAGTRVVIGVSVNQPGYVYLLQTNGPFAGLLLSTDSGLNFSTQSTTPNIMGYECNGSGTSSQASYDLCISIDPANADIVYAGGINIWKSINAGVGWTINSHWVGSSWGTSCAPSVHADIHSLDWSPLNGKLYTGCDGGIYSTSNGGAAWSNISSGLAIAQVYKIGQSATRQNLTINGYQDNGTAKNSGTVFTTVIGGDGMECIVDYSDTLYRYGTIYYGDIRRSTGSSYSTIAKSGVNGITESGGWVTPFILHETVPSTMFAGYKNVWRSANVKAASTSSVAWTSISSGETVNCNVLEQSPADVDILYVSRGTAVKRSDNANAASPAWTTLASPGGTSPTDIEAHPTDSNIVYATAGNKVYKSTNKGASWTNISGTLPSIPVNCIVYSKNSNEGLYIGNQTGVFYKDAGMSDWVLFNSGLPVVDVRELEIYYDPLNLSNNRLKAATYGRGLWQSDLYSGPSLLSVTPWNQNVTLMAASAAFTVSAASTWTASSNRSWCAVTPSGNGNGSLIATFTQNPLTTQRVAVITVTSPGVAPIVLNVIQAYPTTCGSLTINHVAGTTAPVAKTVTYGTILIVSGEPLKCWITSNLGADHQAAAVSDATEASAGWYWQFNRKQGYKQAGSTPYPTWTVASINENLDWQASNDPCALELGSGWRIPTYAEWTNVIGTWTTWSSAWNSGLKLHAAGFLWYSNGSLNNRGAQGYFWSSSQSGTTTGWHLFISSNSSEMISDNDKAFGFSVRCLREITGVPATTTVTGSLAGALCYDATQTITVPGAGGAFTIQNGGSATMIAGQNILYQPGTLVQSGGYLWGYITGNGAYCQAPSMPVIAAEEEVISHSSGQPSFKIFPNPTTGNFILELTGVIPKDKIMVDVYGIWGEKALTEIMTGEQRHQFSLSGMPAGIYLIRVIIGDKSETVRIIKY